MVRNKLLLLFLGSVCYYYTGFAQDTRRPLTLILEDIEKYHDVIFTYSFDVIENIQVTEPSDIEDFEKTLAQIESQTRLTFKPLDETYVSIIQRTTVCGTIFSSTSGEPLSGCSVLLPGGAFITSDSAGQFEIETNLPITVEIRYLGYSSTSIEIKPSVDCDTIYLSEKPYILPEIIIDNFIVEGLRKSVKGSIIIDSEALDLLPGITSPDVLQTVQKLPGIQSFTEKISEINVRGGTNDQNLILWEGIRMYQQGHFFGLISGFNPYLIQDVQLFKNGTPAYYNEGVSSTMVINTSDEINSEVRGGVGLDMLNLDGYLKLPLGEKATINIAARRSIADLVRTPTYENYFERVFRGTDLKSIRDSSNLEVNEDFIFYDVTSSFIYNVSEKDRVKINLISMSNNVSYQESETINGNQESRTSSLDQRNLSGGILYSRLWNSRLKTSGSFYSTNYRLSSLNNDIGNDQVLIQKNEVIESGLKLNILASINERIDIESGYQFFETGITNLEDIDNPPFRRKIKEVIRFHSLYGEFNYQLAPAKSLLSLGLRTNYYEKFTSIRLEPRLSVTYEVNDALQLELLGEIKNQHTSQIVDLQNDFLGVENRRWILANENDFPIIQNKQLSAGLTFSNEKLLLSANGYIKNVDGISSAGQAFQNQFQFERAIGEYSVAGADLLANYFTHRYKVWTSYSYANSKYRFPAYNPPVFPNNLDVRHTISSGLTYELKQFELSLGANWRTGVPYTPADSEGFNTQEDEIYLAPNSGRLPNYLRVDFSGKYKFRLSNNESLVFGISIWNLTNHLNIVNRYYATNQGELTLVNQEALSITPNIMLRYDF